MNLTPQETLQLIGLLAKADPRETLVGRYEVFITPTVYSHEDFVPRKRVCIGGECGCHVVGEVDLEAVTDARAMGGVAR